MSKKNQARLKEEKLILAQILKNFIILSKYFYWLEDVTSGVEFDEKQNDEKRFLYLKIHR